jgi:SagB-type dehydrogenase family enzyme
MMQRVTVVVLSAAIMWFVSSIPSTAQGNRTSVPLPEPSVSGEGMSLTEALNRRQCIRSFNDDPLGRDQLGRLLWSGNGQKVKTRSIDTISGATRTAPSAGGLYPVELYAVVGEVEGLKAGVYHYRPTLHSLELVEEGDIRADLSSAALGQRFIRSAPVTVVITAVYERTTRKYGERGRQRYVTMDAGHAAQNIFLQVTAMGLGTTTVGAFRDVRVEQLLQLSKEEPLYLLPVGVPSR